MYIVRLDRTRIYYESTPSLWPRESRYSVFRQKYILHGISRIANADVSKPELVQNHCLVRFFPEHAKKTLEAHKTDNREIVNCLTLDNYTTIVPNGESDEERKAPPII